MATTTKVITVGAVPLFIDPVFVSGIRSKTEAEDWGKKHGHLVVYWLKRKERAYAETSAYAPLDDLPKSTTKSPHLK